MDYRLTIYNKWNYQIFHGSWIALGWLFAPGCRGCGNPGTSSCRDCQKTGQVIAAQVYDVCGLPQKMMGLCDHGQHKRSVFKLLRSWAVFANLVQEALHRLKYCQDIRMRVAISDQMPAFITQLDWPANAMIPVPLGKNALGIWV